MLLTKDFAMGEPCAMTAKQHEIQAEQLYKQFWPMLEQQQYARADQVLETLNQRFPQYTSRWYAASVLAMQLGRLSDALQNINHGLAAQPGNVHWQLHKAKVLLMTQQREAAKTLLENMHLNPPVQARDCAELALLLNKLGLYKQALDMYQRALKIAPNDPGLLFNLASLQRYMGQLVEAEHTLDRSISLNRADGEAWLLRSSLRKQTPHNNHVPQLEAALAQGSHNPIVKAQLYYALGKELEDLQQYPQCFKALQQGASARRNNMQYQVGNDIATIQKITEVFDSDLLRQPPKGCDNRQAIFILGLPRTGSTLVERILSNHSEVFAAGELNNFALQMMAQVRQKHTSPPANKLKLIEMTRELNFAQLGHDYIKSTQPDTESHPRFIDKLPLNSLYVGLIHLALPNAKIIYLQRHPLDTCFAIFKQLFTNGYPFSYDLLEIAQYQIAHHQLMQHWQRVLPGVIHTLHYEELVADLDNQAKQLLDYCELAWQPQCTQFETNNAATTTASAAQVRQPIYSSSVGKWRHFEQQLLPVKRLFEQAGIVCD